MAGNAGNLMRRTSDIGQSRTSRFAQSMEDTMPRQSGGIAPRPELVAELVCAIGPAGVGDQQRESGGRRGSNDCREVGVDGNRQDGAGLLLTKGEQAVLDVLASKLDDVAAPLRTEESERQRQAGFRADWPMRLELRDLLLGPGVDTLATFAKLHAAVANHISL